MNRKLLKSLLAPLALTLLAPATVQAEDIDGMDIIGWANTWIEVKAAPQGGGRVFASYQSQSLMLWRDEQTFQQPVPVGEMMGVNLTVIHFFANPSTADGYVFGGWYQDDGDGVFDVEKDTFLSDEANDYMLMATLDDEAPIYDSQTAARNGTKPTKSEGTIFAYFTRGASVSTAFFQDDAHANCGSVFIDKKVNEPGDEVTMVALPNDGFRFEYWADSTRYGKIVSRENPYTFTVSGGEHLYAYFTDEAAPEYDLPADGGYKVVNLWDTWVLSDESMLNGATVVVLDMEDLKYTSAGQVYLDAASDSARYDVSQWRGSPTLLYGKGKVRFAFKNSYGFARSQNPLVKWSGDTGTTVKGDIIYVYVFIEELGAFIEIGNTDNMVNPDAPSSIEVPANVAYMTISAFDLSNEILDFGVPSVIGLSPEAYDQGVAGRDHALEVLAGIEGVRADVRTIGGQKVYTLSGLRLEQTPERGVYIVNGRKVVLK